MGHSVRARRSCTLRILRWWDGVPVSRVPKQLSYADHAGAYVRAAAARTYEHLAAACQYGAYTQGADWAYHSKAGSTVSDCTAACDAAANCTGFEFANSGAYCSFWFGDACAGPGSRTWHASSGATTYFLGAVTCRRPSGSPPALTRCNPGAHAAPGQPPVLC